LQGCQEWRVQYEAFQIDPSVLGFDLDPGMKDLFRGDRIDELRHDPALERLVDGETMQPAVDTERAEQRHEKRALRVALAVSVSQHFGRRYVVRAIVTESDLVSDEVISGTDPAMLAKCVPASIRYKVRNRGGFEIQ
jgi:hypothetical protein